MKLGKVRAPSLLVALIIVGVCCAVGVWVNYPALGVTPDPPPCIPQWTRWFVTQGKEPALDIQIQGPEWFETCINVECEGAAGGAITVSAIWSKRDGEKQRQDPIHCANPWKQTAPLVVPQPKITWIAYNWDQGVIAEGSGTTASFSFAPWYQPDGVYVDFYAEAVIHDPDLGDIPLRDSCGVGIQVWRNVIHPTFPGEPIENVFGWDEPASDYTYVTFPCYPAPGAGGVEEWYNGWVSLSACDKFTFDSSHCGVCGGDLLVSKTCPSGWEFSLSVSVAIPSTPININFDIIHDAPEVSQVITWMPKSCYRMPYAWVYKRQIKQINSAKFTGEYYRRAWDCLGRTLSKYHEFPENQDAAVLVGPPNFLNYATVTVQKDCCPNQVPCP